MPPPPRCAAAGIDIDASNAATRNPMLPRFTLLADSNSPAGAQKVGFPENREDNLRFITQGAATHDRRDGGRKTKRAARKQNKRK